jgi:hypothetical protein
MKKVNKGSILDNGFLLVVIAMIIVAIIGSFMGEPDVAGGKDKSINMDIVGFLESTDNPNAISHAGARGQYQIMRGTWNEVVEYMGVDKRDWDYDKCWRDPVKNRKVGETYLNTIIPRYIRYAGCSLKDTKEVRLACYNAGIGTVETAWKEHTYTGKEWKSYLPHETQQFIERYKNSPLHEVR